MSNIIKKELALLVWQFLREEGLADTAHEFERETKCYFDTKYFQELAVHGKWEKAEEYLSGFCKVQDNRFSMEMFFGIRKQKYLEALDRKEFDKAIKILRTDLKMFESVNKEVFQELMSLLLLENFRQNEKLSTYGDTMTARHVMAVELHRLVEQNPLLATKTHLQQQTPAALKTLLVHASGYGPLPPGGNSVQGPVLLPINAHGGNMSSAGATAAAAAAASPHVILNDNTMYPDMAAARAPVQSAGPVASSKRALDPEPAAQPSLKKRAPDVPPVPSEDLPGTLVMYLNADATCCAFHPSNPTLLAVGTSSSSVELWLLPQQERAHELRAHSALVTEGTPVSRISWSKDGTVFGVAFSECKMRGVLHLHRVDEMNVSENRVEVDAHRGGVTDLVCCIAQGKHVAVSGGADGEIKVWSTLTGECIWQTLGHSGAVTTVCPNIKGGVSYILSAGQDGRVRAWLYTSTSFRADYAAPAGRYCTHLAYSSDGTRLFSCGITDSSLVEWNESTGDLNWHYRGYANLDTCHVRIATTAHLLMLADGGKLKVWHMDRPQEVLAVLREDLPPGASVSLNEPGSLAAVAAGPGRVAILASKAGVQLLQPPTPNRRPAINHHTQQQVPAPAQQQQDPPAPTVEGWGSSYMANNEDDHDRRSETKGSGGGAVATPVAAGVEVESGPLSKPWEEQQQRRRLGDNRGGQPTTPTPMAMPTISDRSTFIIQDLPDEMEPSTVQALRFTGSGHALLALCKSGFQKMWQARSGSRSPGPAGGGLTERLAQWQQVGVREMMNEVLPGHPIKGNFAISRNDSYALSTSGGKVSLYNLLGCKLLTTMQAPPPVTTALAFHPRDNNVIALGLDNGTVLLQNVRLDATLQSFRNHATRISDMMFASPTRLVTAGADCKLVIHVISEPKCDQHEVAREHRLEPLKGGCFSPTSGEDMSLCLHPGGDILLCTHPLQLVLFNVLSCHKLTAWSPSRHSLLNTPLVAATYSSYGAHIYASFADSAVAVFDGATLDVVCRISPQVVDPLGKGVYATAIACHPSQDSSSGFVLALLNGVVQVWEPKAGPSADWAVLASAPGGRRANDNGTNSGHVGNAGSGYGGGGHGSLPPSNANSGLQDGMSPLKKELGAGGKGAGSAELKMKEDL